MPLICRHVVSIEYKYFIKIMFYKMSFISQFSLIISRSGSFKPKYIKYDDAKISGLRENIKSKLKTYC